MVRWRRSAKPVPDETRGITKFLWLPMCLEDEWRWLECAYILQCWTPRIKYATRLAIPYDAPYWRSVRWMTKNSKENLSV